MPDLDHKLPRRFVPVGEVITSRGRLVTPVVRPSTLLPCEACRGCVFLHTSCPHLQCSRFDRRDGLNVWFVPAPAPHE